MSQKQLYQIKQKQFKQQEKLQPPLDLSELNQYSKSLKIQEVIPLIQKSGQRSFYDQASIDFFLFKNKERLNKSENSILLKELLKSQPYQRSKQMVQFIGSQFRYHEFFSQFSIDFNDSSNEIFKNLVFKTIPENEVIFHYGDQWKEVLVLIKGSTYHLVPGKQFEVFKFEQKADLINKFQNYRYKLLEELQENKFNRQQFQALLMNIDSKFNLDYNVLKQNFQALNLTETLIQIIYILANVKNMILIGQFQKIDHFTKSTALEDLLQRNCTVITSQQTEIGVIPVQIFQKFIVQKIKDSNKIIFDELKTIQYFKNIDNKILNQLIQFCSIQTINLNQIICKQGERIQSLYFIQNGEIGSYLDNQIQVYYKQQQQFGEEVIKEKKQAFLTYKCSQQGILIQFDWVDYESDSQIHQNDKDILFKIIKTSFESKFKTKNNGKIGFVNNNMANENYKTDLQYIKNKQQKIQQTKQPKIQQDIQKSQIAKLNQQNQNPFFEMQNLSNYYVLKTKYYSPPNFVLYQHQSTNNNFKVNNDFEKQQMIQEKQFSNQMNNTFDFQTNKDFQNSSLPFLKNMQPQKISLDINLQTSTQNLNFRSSQKKIPKQYLDLQ